MSPKAIAPNPLAVEIVRILKRRKQTIATAESITGGLLSGALTDVAGSSAVFLGGLVTYSDPAKTKFLAIPKRILTKHTAVSETVAIAMAESARAQFKSDFAISTTGVAGPGRAYGQKAGTVWVAIASAKETVAVQLNLSGARHEIRILTIESALATFARILAP